MDSTGVTDASKGGRGGGEEEGMKNPASRMGCFYTPVAQSHNGPLCCLRETCREAKVVGADPLSKHPRRKQSHAIEQRVRGIHCRPDMEIALLVATWGGRWPKQDPLALCFLSHRNKALLLPEGM